MRASKDVVFELQQSEKRYLLRYVERANLLDIERERAMFLLNPDPEREFLSDHSSTALLIELFEKYGHRSIFEAKEARKEDFQTNQGQGEWAEQLLLNAEWQGYKLVSFGPSDGIIPKEAGYEERRLRYREFTAIEGKRPDLLVFPEEVEANYRDQIASWQTHPIMDGDIEVFNQCVCGIEVKSSLWHCGQRRKHGEGPLSITVKTEEWADIEFWVNKFRKPLLFVQAFVDEMYVASYRDLLNRKTNRLGYKEAFEPKTKKSTSTFCISQSEPQLAEILTDFSVCTIDDKGHIARPKQWPLAQLNLLKSIPSLLAL